MTSKKFSRNGQPKGKAAFRGSRAHPYVTQMVAREAPRHIQVDKDRFSLFLEETGQGEEMDWLPKGRRDSVSVSIQRRNGTVDVTALEQTETIPLAALADPAAILARLDLADDQDARFAKMCAMAAATWQNPAAPKTPEAPAAPAACDLVIATKKYGIGTTDSPSDPISWWKVNGQDRQTPPRPCTLVDPAIQNRLADYELVGTEVKQLEVIRRYRKIEAEDVARAEWATHRDREGNYYKKGPSGVLVGKVENGSIDWELSRYYHMPEFTEVIP